MYIEDYFDIVNTGERLYSVILDEEELRMFDENSDKLSVVDEDYLNDLEDERKANQRGKKLGYGIAVPMMGLAGAVPGAAAGDEFRRWRNKKAAEKAKKIGKEVKISKLTKHADKIGAAALGLGAGYGMYKLLKKSAADREEGLKRKVDTYKQASKKERAELRKLNQNKSGWNTGGW